MDIRKCKECGKRFDFDKGGLESSFGGVVCGIDCAKRSARKNKRSYAIHNKRDEIIDTDAPVILRKMLK